MGSECCVILLVAALCNYAVGCGGMWQDGREEQNKPRKHGVNTLSFTSFAIFLGIILRQDAAGCGGSGGIKKWGGMRRDAAG